jgi:class 3 adenylate cyclase
MSGGEVSALVAGGIFSPNASLTSHAEHMVRFALFGLRAVNYVNTRFRAALAVRIGINLDRPVVAGILGTDHSTFHMIRDTINVGARLQRTDIPMRRQISEGMQTLSAEIDSKNEY